MVKKILAKSYVYLILLLMYLPILLLVVYSFTASDQVGIWNGFSFKLYSDLFKNKELMSAVGNTFLIAVSSAVVSTILGTLGAIGVFYSSKKTRKIVETTSSCKCGNCYGSFFGSFSGFSFLEILILYFINWSRCTYYCFRLFKC